MAKRTAVCKVTMWRVFCVRTETNMVPNGPVTYQQSKSSFDETPIQWWHAEIQLMFGYDLKQLFHFQMNNTGTQMFSTEKQVLWVSSFRERFLESNFVSLQIKISKSQEWIGNHTCKTLQQRATLFYQCNVNTNLNSKPGEKKVKKNIKTLKYCQNCPSWMNVCPGLFGTFLLQNQLRPLQDSPFLSPASSSKEK